MTAKKDFKKLVRAHMSKTGKSYAAARRDLAARRSEELAQATPDGHSSNASPALDARDLHRVPETEVLRFVDEVLGAPESWPSPLVRYRLRDAAQADWKVEVGHWLLAAKECGFLDRVLHDVEAHAKKRSKVDAIDPNDERHLKLHQHLAVARLVHYLTAQGWKFEAFEPETGGSVDIDASLRDPRGRLVEFQTKAPDQPGRVVDGRIADGEYDGRVVHAVSKAASQLRKPATGAAMIAVCANRDAPLSWNVRPLVKHLMGSTTQVGSKVFLTKASRGVFGSEAWAHVSGVLVLDLIRAFDLTSFVDVTKYGAVVLLNPNAAFPVTLDAFPHARVSYVAHEICRWARGEPRHSTLPDGTALVDDIPESAWAEYRARWADE